VSDRFPNWSTGFYERRIPKRFGISKAVRITSGDGWKDSGKAGDVAFVYGKEMRAPYAEGQFMHVGNPIMASGAPDCRFVRPTIREILAIVPRLILDRRDPLHRGRLKLMHGPFRQYEKPTGGVA
jgi:hypothetical protein